MAINKVKQMWSAGKPVAAGWCSSPDPLMPEVMLRAGFDALILDMQHGMAIGPDRAAIWLQIVGQSDATPIARVPWNEPMSVQWILDAGALGVIVPMINSVEEAKKAIGAVRYPPLAYRSYGPTRARLQYGPDYFATANDEVICLLMDGERPGDRVNRADSGNSRLRRLLNRPIRSRPVNGSGTPVGPQSARTRSRSPAGRFGR